MSESQTGAVRALYPSRLLLPVPAFTFEVPDGWAVQEFPQALALVAPPEPVDRFHVNALITTRRVSMNANLARIAQVALARQRRRHPDLRVESEKVGRFGQRPTYLRALALTAGEPARRVAQVQAFFFAPAVEGRTVTDLFTIFGTCPDEHARDIVPGFLQIIASFDFVPTPPEFVPRVQ
jgi:hypothetical protein